MIYDTDDICVRPENGTGELDYRIFFPTDINSRACWPNCHF